ncbi:hypothetical protein FQN51_008800 [Onygenales sp. PD_10]|nr:hypothetical protein FQN51_008800 [Onygenales sp. PD_10]
MLSRGQSVEEPNSSTDDNFSLTLFPALSGEQPASQPDQRDSSPVDDATDTSSDSSSDSSHYDSSPSPTLDSITSPGSSNVSPLNDSYFPPAKPKIQNVGIPQTPTRRALLHPFGRRRLAGSSPVSPRKRFSSPDRFLPKRDPDTPDIPPFRLSKNPLLLSPGEKLLRQRDPRADPFAPYQPRRRAQVSRSSQGSDHRDTPHHLPRHVDDTSLYSQRNRPVNRGNPRQISAGAVWHVGGSSPAAGGTPLGIQDGHGGLISSGSSAPMYLAKFLDKDTHAQHLRRHESRLAMALDIDQASKVLKFGDTGPPSASKSIQRITQHDQWPYNTWKHSTRMGFNGSPSKTKTQCKPSNNAVPSTPFRVLDAPLLRDDFYCSTLAYSYTTRMLAVGLSSRVYLWSELSGVQYPPLPQHESSNYVTSLSFSSPQGGNSILAVGRQGGQVSLWSSFDSDVRFEFRQPSSVSCVSFKQTTTRRSSVRFHGLLVDTEDLAVGDDLGNVWYYSVEWPDATSRERHRWNGATTLLAKIAAHTQQICGLVWSPDGKYFATGGNDNACLLFEIARVLGDDTSTQKVHFSPSEPTPTHSTTSATHNGRSRFPYHPHLNRIFDWSRINQLSPIPIVSTEFSRPTPSDTAPSRPRLLGPRQHQAVFVPSGRQKFRFAHSAAVKAIAFAPWQPSLLATGGGSNDRCIHFYHTSSGACLATINVHAQVTSLIWSKTRREIAATFGYAQPEHPFRIAVFAWPSCEQVVAIPWGMATDGTFRPSDNSVDCGRALWAIGYPGGPNDMPRAHYTGDHASSSTTSSTTIAAPQAGTTEATETTTTTSNSPGSTNSARATTSSPTAGPRVAYREGGTWWSRTAEEGCIIVASSDECVKFHEVWSGSRKSTTGTSGQLGGSDILESLEGIEKEGDEIIR